MPTLIKVVSFRRILLGLFVAALGAGLVAFVFLEGGRIRLRVLGIGVVLILIGGAIAVGALRQEVCSNCRVPLEPNWTALPLDSRAQIETAIQAAFAGNLGAISGLAALSFPPVDWAEAATFECEYCPKCESLSRVAVARRKRLPDGNTTEHDLTPWVVIAGPPAKKVLALLTTRNNALTEQMTSHYGGR